MPSSDLDPSWRFAINQAVGQHLIFGRDIIFTFGPYAAIYTKQYHPATDTLALLGSSYLALCYTILLLLLLRNSHIYAAIAFGILLGFFMKSMDALLLSYSLLLSLASYRIILPDSDSYKIHQNNVAGLAFLLLFIPLGLLPLIKSTLIISSALTMGLCSAMFLYDRKAWFACAVILFPIFGLVLFWHLAGQPLDAIPDFFISANAIVSGYSESMQLSKKPVYALLFLITAFLILRNVLSIASPKWKYRVFLVFGYLIFLFISFKAGLVRYDSVHSIISASALIIAIITLAFISSKKIPLWLIVLGIVSCWLIGKKNIVYVAYIDAWKGAEARLQHELPGKYESSLANIRAEYAVETVAGTTDIYAYHQAYLLASQNQWVPRPVLQSYSAYTFSLAGIDANHLSGANAPDNILFRVETIDNRLPSLDDGASWPVLMQRYELTHQDEHYVYLKKRTTAPDVIHPAASLHSGEYALNQTVNLPEHNLPLYAVIDIKPAFLGRLLSLIYKQPELSIELALIDGESKKFRINSGMAKAGFVLSPLVENTDDFVSLMTRQTNIGRKAIKSIIIHPESGASVFWSSKYTLQLNTLN